MGNDGTIHTWEPNATGAPSRSFRAASQARSAEVGEDGRAAVVSDSDARMAVVDLESGRVLREIASSPGSSRFVLVDVAQKRIITGGTDGIVRILNLDTGASLAQIISTVNGWAALDGQGRFDGTPAGVQDVQWLAAQLSLPVDNFSEAYFEPGLVAKYMRDQPSFVAPAPTAVEAGSPCPRVY
jgi:WD40 repeat protein